MTHFRCGVVSRETFQVVWGRDFAKAITCYTTDTVFARYNKPSLDTLRAVVEGKSNTEFVN